MKRSNRTLFIPAGDLRQLSVKEIEWLMKRETVDVQFRVAMYKYPYSRKVRRLLTKAAALVQNDRHRIVNVPKQHSMTHMITANVPLWKFGETTTEIRYGGLGRVHN